MKQYYGRVSSKGQITLPAEVREELGIKPRDRVAITIQDKAALVRRTYSSIMELYGSVPALERNLTDEEITQIAAEEAAQAAAREGLPDE
jgi:antitoxin PrlF